MTQQPFQVTSALDPETHTDWFVGRLSELREHGLPLPVPLTVTFRPGSIPAKRCLREFGRLYARLTRMLLPNPDRASKRPLLPFTLAYLDDPSTRWKGSRPVYFSDHPQVAPHVHVLLLVHPDLVGRFEEVACGLPGTWRALSPWTNATCHVDLRSAAETRALLEDLEANEGLIRARIRGWIGYSSKLGRRRHDPELDTYDVFPRA